MASFANNVNFSISNPAPSGSLDEIETLKARLKVLNAEQTTKGASTNSAYPNVSYGNMGTAYISDPQLQQRNYEAQMKYIQDMAQYNNLRWVHWKRIFNAEWAASMIQGFIVWVVIYNISLSGAALPAMFKSLFVAMALFFSTMLAMASFMPYSNAHINPLVTFAFWWTKKISTMDFLVYFLGQFAGFWTAFAMMVWTFWPNRAIMWNVLVYAPNYTDSQGWLLELCIQIIFFIIIFMLYLNREMGLDTSKGKDYCVVTMSCLIASTYFILSFASSNITNSPINIFLAFIPAIVSGAITSTTHYLYWVSAIAAGIFVFFIIMRPLVDHGIYGEPKDNHSYKLMFTPVWQWFSNMGWRSSSSMRPIVMPGGIYGSQPFSILSSDSNIQINTASTSFFNTN